MVTGYVGFVPRSRSTDASPTVAQVNLMYMRRPNQKMLANPTRQLHFRPAHLPRQFRNQLAGWSFEVARASLASVRPMPDKPQMNH